MYVLPISFQQASVGALRQLAAQLLSQHARYEAALGVLCKVGGSGAASAVQHKAAVQAAQAGLARAAARYTALRGAVAVVNPLLWTWYVGCSTWCRRQELHATWPQVGAGHGHPVAWERLPARTACCVCDCGD